MRGIEDLLVKSYGYSPTHPFKRVCGSPSDTESHPVLKLEIPVLFIRILKGRIAILIDRTRLPYFLELQPSDIEALSTAGLITAPVEEKIPPKRIDYPQLAMQYRAMLNSGRFTTRSALARELGVSRAWIWRVMNR